MKKILLCSLMAAFVCLAINVSAQTTIKPFTPNQKDAEELKTLLAQLDKSEYSVKVRKGNAVANYGGLGMSKVKMRSAKTIGGTTSSSWVTEVLTKVLTKTREANRVAVERIRAIAMKYNAL
jgi:phage I-like protein